MESLRTPWRPAKRLSPILNTDLAFRPTGFRESTLANGLEHTSTRRKPLAHIGVQSAGMANAGDVVLSDVVRQAIGAVTHTGHGRERASTTPVTPQTVEAFNRSTAGVVVGGGGLFLADSNPNALSGWQWPVAAKVLRRPFSVPLAVFAVGYSRFRGQDRFSDRIRR